MKLTLQATLSLGLLALCLASSPVKWCTISTAEQEKCLNLQRCLNNQQLPNLSQFGCVRKADYLDCIKAIANHEADAVTLDGGQIFDANLHPHNLKPVIAEVYHRDDGDKHSYYAVAVAMINTVASLEDLQGKKSCHTGWGRAAGWVAPVGVLLEKNYIKWDGKETEPLEKAVARFFSASCVPGAPKDEPSLCRLCAGTGPEKCSRNDPYSGYSGAFDCLKAGAGDVAFVNHNTVLALHEEERAKYELLCPDGTKRPVEDYSICYLAKVPAHAVVVRNDYTGVDDIWALLSYAEDQFKNQRRAECQVRGSPAGKDLLFKDSAVKLVRIPKLMDAKLYLSYEFYTSVQNLRRERPPAPATDKIVWCAVGKPEKTKCDTWSGLSDGHIDCAVGETTEDCIISILKGEADSMSLDGGHVYTAGKCGLVPAMAEVYKIDPAKPNPCDNTETPATVKGYTAVAVAKAADVGITWHTLKGKKSCHTGVDRTAGWNIPMGLIYKQNNGSCDFGKFFSASCAPGAPIDSPLCRLCKGSEAGLPELHKCKPNSNERYYGYNGAFRCLIEVGDVAFVKDSTVPDNTGDDKPAWAHGKRPEDFVLLKPDGTRCPVTQFRECGLAAVPTHAVVTRLQKRKQLQSGLCQQQKLFGSNGSRKDEFQMFQSQFKDDLFKDGTQCLVVPKEMTYKDFLGQNYLESIAGLKSCSPSELLKVCNFISEDNSQDEIPLQ